MNDLINRLNEVKEEYNRLQQQFNEFSVMPDDQKLAELIHEKICRSNHEDQCGFFYENWKDKERINGEFSTKGSYLKKARLMLNKTDFETAFAVINQL